MTMASLLMVCCQHFLHRAFYVIVNMTKRINLLHTFDDNIKECDTNKSFTQELITLTERESLSLVNNVPMLVDTYTPAICFGCIFTSD